MDWYSLSSGACNIVPMLWYLLSKAAYDIPDKKLSLHWSNHAPGELIICSGIHSQVELVT